MDNGGEAAVGTVVVREEDPSTDAAAIDVAAELMVTPRSEMPDIGTPDATTPVMRGGATKDHYGDEADAFELAVQEDEDDAATLRCDKVDEEDTGAVDGGGGGYDDGQGGAGEDRHEHVPDSPPLYSDDGAPSERPYEEAPGAQVGEEQTSEAGLAGSAAEDSDAAPNNGEVIGGYDEGPGPDENAQQADDDVPVAANNGAVVQEEVQDVASIPVSAPQVVEYLDRDMQIDDSGEVHRNGNHESGYVEGPRHEHDGTLENGLINGDGEDLLQPEPASPLEGLVPPTQDKVLQSEDPSAEQETDRDGQGTLADDFLEATSSVQDVTEAGSKGVPDTADDSDKVVLDASPQQVQGTTTALRSPDCDTDTSGATNQYVVYDRWSDFVRSREEAYNQNKVAPKAAAADVLSQASDAPPKLDTPMAGNSNGSVDDDDNDEDEAESSLLQPPPLAAVQEEEQKASAASQSHPSGLGSSAPLPEPAARVVQQQQPRVNGSVSHRQIQPSEDAANGEVEEYDETREKLQMIRVKFLRLAHRLGQTPHNVVVAQVLYRLGLAEQLRGSMNTSRAGAFSFDRASALAEQLETAGQEPLDFSCTIMVIGKTGVGKSATINSIFDEVRLKTDAFQLGTKKVQEIVGTVQGIKVRVIDTPGLLPSLSDQVKNEKILQSVKKFIKKNPPDVIMYLDRLDMQNRDLGDVPLLRTISNIFGPPIWFNAIVVLTHAASAPPEGANGSPLSYEMYVTQRTHVIQNAIRQAAADPRLLNPVSLVENHSACRMNRAGQRVLPNGQVWKPHLLLLSFASKILTEANMLLKLQDAPASRTFGSRHRSPPLPFFLSSLLQSRPQVKLPDDQSGEDDPIDMDVDEESESDDETDYDELPPFKKLTNEQVSRLSKAQKKAYFEEMDYRERLFFKKQLKEERRRRRLLKKMAAEAKNIPSDEYINDNIEDENSAPATVPVPMPDMALPASFDSDYPSHRYRFLDSASQWIVRPVLETQGWDHDIGYEGVNVERLFVVRDKIPLSVSGQLTKDKKESTLQMEMASSVKHGEGKATSLGLDLQSIGKDMAYTLRGETRFSNFRRNSTAAGISATLLGDTLSAGLKIEDKLTFGKRFKMLVSGGAMSGRGDVAYGGRLEATLRDKDYPLGRQLSTLALSVVDWHGDLAVGCNLTSQIPVGRSTNMTAHANLNNRGTGQICVRVNSSEQLLLAMAALAPLLSNARKYIFGSSESL